MPGNAEYKHAWYEKNKERIKANRHKNDVLYRERHKEEIRTRKRNFMANKIANDPSFRLSVRLRTAIWTALCGNKKGRRWETLVGYSVQELMSHLEKYFKKGMSWDNYGEWHIDHIIPISAFHYKDSSDIDFKRCWALKNLRPMWATDNMRKSAKIDKPFQPALRIAI